MMFYGVFYEYYTDGSLKSGIVPKEFKKQPKKAKRKSSRICTAYEYWLKTETDAKEIKINIDEIVKNKDDMSHFYSGFISEAA
jgi:hypothetical protein